MRKVDGDTHISGRKYGARISAEEMIAKLDECGIDSALTWVHPQQQNEDTCDFPAENKYVYESAKKYPDRFLPMGWLNPTQYSFKETSEQIKRYTDEYGFYGIKLNGALGKYSIIDEEISLPVIELIAKTGCVLAFHCDGSENVHPDKVAKIASMASK